MNSIDLFLNDESKVCIYYGGAGKGGTMTGILKLKKYIREGLSCAVVMRNGKDLSCQRGVIEYTMREFEAFKVLSKKLIRFENNATITFLTSDELDNVQFDCIFLDNANQVDERFSLEYLESRCNILWMNTNSTKTRGFIFDSLKPHLIKVGNYYKPSSKVTKIGDVTYIYGTCKDNPSLINEQPDYIPTLNSLPIDLRQSLLKGYFVEKIKDNNNE